VLSDEVVLRAGGTGLEAQSRKRQLLLDEIRSRGSLSTAEGAALLSEDLVTVRHRLNDLASAGLVRADGKTRARRYRPI
jgi:DeoR/GlpR family transcriptional regulator of sugar metabolism